MRTVFSKNNILIRLTDERWFHIVENMEKTVIEQLQPLLPQIISLSKTNKSLSFDYDEEADVLYISLRKPQQATDTEMVNDDLLIRKRNNDIVGITIMHASSFHAV